MRRFLPSLAAGLLLLLLGGCKSPAEPEALAALPLDSAPVPTAPAEAEGARVVSAVPLDDLARYLAGLPGPRRSPLAAFRDRDVWQRYSRNMDALWNRFSGSRQPRIAEFSRTQLAGQRNHPVVWYPFSGPDILFAETFFPGAAHYELCGLESCVTPPDLTALSVGQHDDVLSSLYQSLTTALPYSFFVTADMRADLGRTPFKGTLPVVLVSLARLGCVIDSVEPVALDAAGRSIPGAQGGPCPGYTVRYRSANGRAKSLSYYKLNLADSALRRDGRYLTHMRSSGAPVTFLKSASYLMHKNEFSLVRRAILDHSAAILQDDSGIPYRLLEGSSRDITLYGRYTGVLDIFRPYYQFDLLQAYFNAGANVRPIDFGLGYKHQAGNSALLLSTKR